MSDWPKEAAQRLYGYLVSDEKGFTVPARRDIQLAEDAIAAALRKAREDALEEAAKLADEFTTTKHIAMDVESGIFPNQSTVRAAIAAAIRALKQKDTANE